MVERLGSSLKMSDANDWNCNRMSISVSVERLNHSITYSPSLFRVRVVERFGQLVLKVLNGKRAVRLDYFPKRLFSDQSFTLKEQFFV